MLDHIQHIAHDCRRGGEITGTAAIEHHIAHSVTTDHHGVEDIIHCGNRRALFYQMGCHEGCDPAVFHTLCMSQQLHTITSGCGNIHILEIQRTDTLHADLRRLDFLSPGKVRKNTDLAACIDALHVSRGVGLRIALGLGLLQRLGKGNAALDHTGKDIIGGTVQNTCDLFDLVGSQALEQGAQQRNTTANACLKEIIHILFLCDLQKLPAMSCHQLLVGGHHVLSG